MASESPVESLADQIVKIVLASDNPIDSLADQIIRKTRKNWKKEEFLPENLLLDLTQRSIVKAALEATSLSTQDVEDLADFGCGKDVERLGRRLFLILVMMSEEKEQLSFLKHLRDSGVDDSALPIGFYSGGPFDRQGYLLEDDNRNIPGLKPKRFPIFADMTRSNRVLFNSDQWRFLAPVFRSDKFRFQFDKSRIMPYLNVSPKPVSSGYFGEVSRAEVLAVHVPESLRVSSHSF